MSFPELSPAARQALRVFLYGKPGYPSDNELHRMSQRVQDELYAAGFPIQRERPLHEGVLYYPMHGGSTVAREAWRARAELAIGETA